MLYDDIIPCTLSFRNDLESRLYMIIFLNFYLIKLETNLEFNNISD